MALAIPTQADREALAGLYHRLRVAEQELEEASQELYRLHYACFAHREWKKHQLRGWEKLQTVRDEANYGAKIDKAFGGRLPRETEWWEQAHRRDLYNNSEWPPNNLHFDPLAAMEAYEASEESVRSLTNAQADIRQIINERSRPFLRSLSVQDLPNEILLAIFEQASHTVEAEFSDADTQHSLYRHSYKPAEIANIRLVCRRFHDLGSDLLLRSVRVEVGERSLQRLVDMPGRSELAAGIREIEIYHIYKHPVDDRTFFEHHYESIDDQLEDYHDLQEEEESAEESEQAADPKLERAVALHRALALLSGDAEEDDPEPDQDLVSQLKNAFNDYLRLVRKQQELLKTGSFAESVASAMARLPNARKLRFTLPVWEDQPALQALEKAKPLSAMDDPTVSGSWDAILKNMLLEVVLPDPDDPSAYYGSVIVDVLNAARLADVFPKVVEISLWVDLGLRTASLEREILQMLSCSMQELEVFEFSTWGSSETFWGDYRFNLEEDRLIEQRCISKFLSACLNTPSLKQIYLYPHHWHRDRDLRFDYSEIMGSISRPKLTHFTVHGLVVDFEELVTLLEKMPRLSHLNLYRPRLLSGTWQEALDLLRAKKLTTVHLRQPRGGDRRALRDHWIKVFSERNHRPGSLAEEYILGDGSDCPNPLSVPLESLVADVDATDGRRNTFSRPEESDDDEFSEFYDDDDSELPDDESAYDSEFYDSEFGYWHDEYDHEEDDDDDDDDGNNNNEDVQDDDGNLEWEDDEDGSDDEGPGNLLALLQNSNIPIHFVVLSDVD